MTESDRIEEPDYWFRFEKAHYVYSAFLTLSETSKAQLRRRWPALQMAVSPQDVRVALSASQLERLFIVVQEVATSTRSNVRKRTIRPRVQAGSIHNGVTSTKADTPDGYVREKLNMTFGTKLWTWRITYHLRGQAVSEVWKVVPYGEMPIEARIPSVGDSFVTCVRVNLPGKIWKFFGEATRSLVTSGVSFKNICIHF